MKPKPKPFTIIHPTQRTRERRDTDMYVRVKDLTSWDVCQLVAWHAGYCQEDIDGLSFEQQDAIAAKADIINAPEDARYGFAINWDTSKLPVRKVKLSIEDGVMHYHAVFIHFDKRSGVAWTLLYDLGG